MIVNKDLFAQNLILTQHYCEDVLARSTGNTTSVLRSFNPQINGKPIFEYKPNEGILTKDGIKFAQWTVDPLDGNVINELFHQQLLQKERLLNHIDTNRMFKGRILTSSFDDDIFDGISEYESDGFIDYYDLSPIDTWFYLETNEKGQRKIYSWIPEPFVEYANVGVEVNLLACLEWHEPNV